MSPKKRSSLSLGLFSLLVACGAPAGSPGQLEAPLRGGDPRPWSGTSATVSLGACSGVLLNRHTIATAEHCLPTTPDGSGGTRSIAQVSLPVRGGARAERCLSEEGGRCVARDLQVVHQPSSDLVLLRSAPPFTGVSDGDLALVAAGGTPQRLRAQGYGESDLAPAGAAATSLSADFAVTHADGAFLYGRAPAEVGVCGGDSGGPAFDGDIGDGAPVALGVLGASQPDRRRASCTAAGGIQRWTRFDPRFIAAHAGPCQSRRVGGGEVLDCSRGGATAPQAAPSDATAAALPLQTLRGLFDGALVAAQPGAPGAATPRQPGPAGAEPIGAMTAQGPYTLWVDRAKLARPPARSLEDGGGDGGQLVPMISRGLSLSNGFDSRRALFTIEAGGVRGYDGTTGSPGCTGTLIGSRLVRTAAHCVNFSGPNYFTVRYDGGLTTWTFDGGRSYVTFRPVAAQGYYYGGNYFNFGCDNSATRYANRTNHERCAAQDWAILILPEDAWAPQHVVPTYMGYSSPSVGAVSNVGYPSCSDVSSPYINPCVAGKMYGQSCSISVNYTSMYYTSCDTSPGHSGGPTYTSSGGAHYLVGHHVAGPFNGVACSGSACPSQDTGTDSWLFNFQNQLRTSFGAVRL